MESNSCKKPAGFLTLKSKVDMIGESTTDKDTEDENEKTSAPKILSDTKAEEDIQKVTEDLLLSEDDGTDPNEKAKKIMDNKNDKNEFNNVNVDSEETSCLTLKKSNKEDSEKDTKVEVEISNFNSDIQGDEDKNKSKEGSENQVELIEVEDLDDYLMYLEEILKNIHKAYYEEYDFQKKINSNCVIPDLKTVIPNFKKNTLKGCHLVFSGLVPSHIPLQESRAYLVAISLGAIVSADISSNCTHLVAARPGTAKVNSSRRHKGIFIVTPLWLWHCAERWEKVDEKLYPLGKYNNKYKVKLTNLYVIELEL